MTKENPDHDWMGDMSTGFLKELQFAMTIDPDPAEPYGLSYYAHRLKCAIGDLRQKMTEIEKQTLT